MRFVKGHHYPHPPRGPGRGQYHMSRLAYQTRLRNLLGWHRPRTYEQTRRIELEIALATHQREPLRATAKRLGLRSHTYCWKIGRKYRAGLIPMLPRSLQELLAMRDSLYGSPATAPASVQVPETHPKGMDGHGWNCACGGCRISRLIAEVVGS